MGLMAGGRGHAIKIWCKIQIIINYSYEVATLIKMRNPWPLKIEASCLSKEYQTYLDPFELYQQKYNLFKLVYRSIFKQDMLQNKTKA